MRKVHIFVPPELRGLESRRSRFGLVTITLSDGSVIARRATQIRGQPPLFLTDEEVDKKFYDCVVPVLGGAKAEDLLNFAPNRNRLERPGNFLPPIPNST